MLQAYKKETASIVTEAEWLTATHQFSDISYRQCASYAQQAAKTNGATVEFVLIKLGPQILGAAAIRLKKIPMLPIGIAYIHHGPITAKSDGFSTSIYTTCLNALIEYYVGTRKLTLRIVPPDSATLADPNIDKAITELGFETLNRAPRKTFVVDLRPGLPAIRKSLEGRWRNKLNQAEKVATIRIDRSENWNDFSILDGLLTELERKKTFHASQNVEFFTEAQKQSRTPADLRLYVGYNENRPISAHLCDFSGDIIVSLLAATNDEGRETKISHRMQWAVIEDGCALGKTGYDLGGIDAEANPGVYTFKKGLNGVELTEPGTFEKTGNGLLSATLKIAERIYRRLRKRS